jgi:hypothetical protein
MPEYRLGDVIDDYCVKCKRIMNHSLVSMLNQEPAKVRCRTCHSDHDYRHEQPPPPKTDLRKAALFNEVLAKMGGTPGAAAGAKTATDDPTEIHDPDEPPEVQEPEELDEFKDPVPAPDAPVEDPDEEPKAKRPKAKAKRQR